MTGSAVAPAVMTCWTGASSSAVPITTKPAAPRRTPRRPRLRRRPRRLQCRLRRSQPLRLRARSSGNLFDLVDYSVDVLTLAGQSLRPWRVRGVADALAGVVAGSSCRSPVRWRAQGRPTMVLWMGGVSGPERDGCMTFIWPRANPLNCNASCQAFVPTRHNLPRPARLGAHEPFVPPCAIQPGPIPRAAARPTSSASR